MEESILTKVPDISYTEANVPLDPKEFIKVVQSRRSVRVFNDTKIPEQIMNSCLDIALLAPNSSNLQPWTFYWVKNPEIKQKIVEACLSQPAAKTAAEIIVCVARIGTWQENRLRMLEAIETSPKPSPQAIDYYKRLVPLVYSLGLFGIVGYLKKILLFFWGLNKVVVREPTTKSQMITWATKSTALACENLMLALSAYSFDSCPMEGFDSCRVKKALDIPSDGHVTMIIAAGKRAPNGIYGPRVRFKREYYIKEV